MAYISDESVMEEQKVCRRILQELNTVDRSDFVIQIWPLLFIESGLLQSNAAAPIFIIESAVTKHSHESSLRNVWFYWN